MPDVMMSKVSWNGNFSHPMNNVSKASEPSVRCSSKSSSDSASFSPRLILAEAVAVSADTG